MIKKTFIGLLVAFGLSFLAQCEEESKKASKSQELSSEQKNEMLKQVNLLRSSGCTCGETDKPKVDTLVWNNKLEEAAIAQAVYMDKIQKLTHDGPNNNQPMDRVKSAGYKPRAVGENVAWNYKDVYTVVLGWEASEGHCNNMMNPEFTEMGAAKVGEYWVQVFGDTFD